MSKAIAKPRGILSIVFISFFLGPFWLMLWLGRGRLALIYLLATVVVLFALAGMEQFGWVSTASITSWFPVSLAYLITSAALFLVGMGHGLGIRQSSTGRPWYRWIAIIPTLVVLASILLLLPIRAFLYRPFSIPSASSEPNLVPGDYVFVAKYAYGYSRYSFPFNLVSFEGRTGDSRPSLGDLTIFKNPSDTAVDYVKRVAGLPSDRIQMKGGLLYINGSAVRKVPAEIVQLSGTGYNLKYFRETLPNGASYVVAEMSDDSDADNTVEFIVPEEHYFVLGDSRDNSMDSRYPEIGFVPAENFIGPVVWLFMNTEGRDIASRPQEIHP